MFVSREGKVDILGIKEGRPRHTGRQGTMEQEASHLSAFQRGRRRLGDAERVCLSHILAHQMSRSLTVGRMGAQPAR